MSEYAGRIAVGAIVAVALVVGLAFELNYLVPNSTTSSLSTSSTSTSSLTTPSAAPTSWFGPEGSQGSCGSIINAVNFTGNGYTMDMYLSSPPTGTRQYLLGSTLCIYTYLRNIDDQSTSLPSVETVTVTGIINQSKISEITFFQSRCAAPSSYAGSFGPNSTGWNCVATWNTSEPYLNGTLPSAAFPDTYMINATITMADSFRIFLPYSFGFTTSPPSVATTTSIAAPTFSCGGPTFKLLTPLQSGSISLKVTTDQGAIVNNGTVFVTHIGTNGTSNYCLRLEPSSTGYLQIAANDGLSPTGTYNVTVAAGFNQGPGYEGSLPSVAVTTSTSVELTLSVPSGAVSIVTSTQGSSQVSTTTTTATSVESQG